MTRVPAFQSVEAVGALATTAEAIGAIENALLDAKAKHLGIPCYELLGGKIRDRIRVYWSHCATWRISGSDWYRPAITDLDGVKQIGREVREKKFTALKTNIFTYTDGKPENGARRRAFDEAALPIDRPPDRGNGLSRQASSTMSATRTPFACSSAMSLMLVGRE